MKKYVFVFFVLFFWVLFFLVEKKGRSFVHQDKKYGFFENTDMVLVNYLDYFWVVSRDFGTGELVEKENIYRFTPEKYEVTPVDSWTSLDYATGKVVGFEKILDTNDAYLLLEHGGEGVSKYRIVLNDSVFLKNGGNLTKLWAECVFCYLLGGEASYKRPSIGMSYDNLFTIVKKGDVVTVSPPTFVYPVSNVLDQNKSYYVNDIFVRRTFGVNELNFEFNFLVLLKQIVK